MSTPKLYRHTNIWHWSTIIPPHSSVTTLFDVNGHKNEMRKMILEKYWHVDSARLQYRLMLAHSVHLDHKRNRKTFPCLHVFIFKRSHHEY